MKSQNIGVKEKILESPSSGWKNNLYEKNEELRDFGFLNKKKPGNKKQPIKTLKENNF